jgi:light-harvesting protein B-800-850 alpha chain
MNQGRIWCVVSPTIGLPLFLGSVAAISLTVHAEVLSHSTWMAAYWQGGAKAKVAMNTATPNMVAKTAVGYSVTITPPANGAATPASFTITVSPNSAPAVRAASVETAAPPQLGAPIQSASAN